MRALVPAGGEGSRLRPITSTNAKQLIPVAGTPILFHALRSIADAGIREVVVILGSTGDEIRAAVGTGERFGLDVSYVTQEAPLGLAHCVMVAEELLRGDSFLMYLGDNVLLEGVTGFVERFKERGPDAQILLTRVAEPEHFGVAVLEEGRVVHLVEKPKEFVSDHALVGVYLFGDSIFEACRALEPSWRGEYEITEAIQWLIDHERTVDADMVTGYWKDTGRPGDLLEANRVLLALQERRIDGDVDADTVVEGAVVVEAGAKVTRSVLRGPVVIGAGTILDGSTVGPNVSIEPGCEILRSEISDSIVMGGCRIDHVSALTGSILGRNVEVRRSGSLHLIVGDQSHVEVR